MTIKQEKKQKKQPITKKPKLAARKANSNEEQEGMVTDGLNFTTTTTKDETSSSIYPNPLLQLFAQNAATSSPSSDYNQQLAMASSLAQVIVSPINLSSLSPSNLPPALFQQLQQLQQQHQNNMNDHNNPNMLNEMKDNTTCLQQIDNSRMNHQHHHPIEDKDPSSASKNNEQQEGNGNNNHHVNNNKNEATTTATTTNGNSSKKTSMSLDEKRQKRLWRNRLAAKECRKKKKLYVHEMEEKVQRLESENATLHNTIKELSAKLEEPQQQQSAENYRLMKEVEELNAKLGMNA